MGILKGKDTALEHIEKSKLAFLATLCEVNKGPAENAMPPKDHFILKFNRDSIRNLKGRVYETMKQYAYEQLGSLFLYRSNMISFEILLTGESIPAFFNAKETESGLINPTKPPVPIVGRQYVACIYEDLKRINCLIEIGWNEVDELVKIANSRRKSVV
ncbi:unnamed protein product [Rotaria sp. Silwood1]|nr:unnamed protein product [Rotaria sp. Silwood1]CAF3611618.1 unnamed protein product [Rotaria sp. Silwood1]CAF3687463.1 unnamed protein product [Rotaria sp. Silwood1]CAF4706057.1 unnamed protein product [Rotaria sp. Silwood1]CAF4826516.1 unnamed protein product [Rotaria sp. Silwood1]